MKNNTTISDLIVETELEDKAVRLAYLWAKAKRKYDRMIYGSLSATSHDLEISRRAFQRITRWCCKNAIDIHTKYQCYRNIN